MQRPAEIVFRGLDRSDAMEERVNDRVDALQKRFNRLQTCRVTIDGSHKHKHKGRSYEVTIDIHVPGETLVVSDVQEDAYGAIRDAFQIASRKLDDWQDTHRAAATVDPSRS